MLAECGVREADVHTSASGVFLFLAHSFRFKIIEDGMKLTSMYIQMNMGSETRWSSAEKRKNLPVPHLHTYICWSPNKCLTLQNIRICFVGIPLEKYIFFEGNLSKKMLNQILSCFKLFLNKLDILKLFHKEFINSNRNIRIY